jgi:hypothetical protein
MTFSKQHLTESADGTSYFFKDWPNPEVPTYGARVYTVWNADGEFMYVGMSGKGLTETTNHQGNKPKGLYTRLRSHASGKRSGDQFCVYVADRLVLPKLSQDDLAGIVSGRHAMDAFVRRYIHENLCYRFAMLPDGKTAQQLETVLKRGQWKCGRPFLNPGRSA